MRERHRIISLALLLALSSAAAANDEYVVTLAGGSSAASPARLASRRGATIVKHYRRAVHGFVARMTPAAAAALAADAGVLRVEPNTRFHATQIQANAPWGLDRIDQDVRELDGMFHASADGDGVPVYVIDTGIIDHHDLAGRIGDGYDAVGDGLGTRDCNGHGTHVAGTIAGTIHGVAKQAYIEPVRVLDCNGDGTLASILDGIDWVLENHAGGVVNLSLGGAANPTLDAAVSQLAADGLVVVVAAGNENVDACEASPARAAGTITVGATGRTDARAAFSNWGACVDLFAPGEGIVSLGIATPTATETFDGTSMAAPHVAGALAAYLGEHPDASVDEVKAALLAGGSRGKVTDLRGSGDILLNTRFIAPSPPDDDDGVTPPLPGDDGDAGPSDTVGGCSTAPGAGGSLVLFAALVVLRGRRGKLSGR